MSSDDNFIRSWEDCSLNDSEFTHKAHVRVAWIYLTRFPLNKAIDKCCRGIERFDKLNGDGTKYHKTLTVFAVLLIQKLMQSKNYASLDAFLHDHDYLITDFMDSVLCFYDKKVLFSTEAKTSFIPPSDNFFEPFNRVY